MIDIKEHIKNRLRTKLNERTDGTIPPDQFPYSDTPEETFPYAYPELDYFPDWGGPPGPWDPGVLDRQRDWGDSDSALEFWLMSYPWLKKYLNDPELLYYIMVYLRYSSNPNWNMDDRIPRHILQNPRFPWRHGPMA